MFTYRSNGLAIARVLSAAWRVELPPLAECVTEAVPLLEETGAGALGYRRLQQAGVFAAARLRQAYRLHTLQSAIQQQHLVELFTRLRSAGVEPLLVKGWSVARLYAEAGLRPAGDIDLCVHPNDLEKAMAVLTEAAGQCGSVDLHVGVADLDRSIDHVYARSLLVPLGDVEVRILGAEDQLRHLCLHLLRHGGWRPVWLCDVAAALEALPADFDWDDCLSGERRKTDWVRCAISLAQELLGARVPRADVVRALPAWVKADVLESWGRGAASNDAVRQAFTGSLRSWKTLVAAIRQRWPNRVRAAYKLGVSPFVRLPLAPLRLAAFLCRGIQYALSRPAGRRSPHPFDVHPSQVR
jgi:hypothetical protein